MSQQERTGTIVQARYRLLRLAGEGSQGKVYEAEDLARAGEIVALKLVEELVGGRRDNSADDVLRWFQHPNWAAVQDVGPWGESGWFEVTRFIYGSNLASVSGPQPDEFVLAFLEQGARVLGALHRQGVIHYDVTPGNWMVEQRDGAPHFILTDGGLAHLGPVRGFGRGTPRYMAPEVTQDGDHDHRADLYSLGLVAFQLAAGREAFEGRAGEVLGKRRRERAPKLSTITGCPPRPLEAVLDRLLERNPADRFESALDLLEALPAAGHPIPALLTPEEVSAALSGGPISPQDSVARCIDSLFTHLTGAAEQAALEPSSAIIRCTPAVAIVSGGSGTGSTRIALEILHRARTRDIAVVLVDGRAHRGAYTRPLRDLQTSLESLSQGRDTNSPPPTEHEAAAQTVEELVRIIDGLSDCPSLLFIVSEFPLLDRDTQTALEAIARHLQIRVAMHSSAAQPMSIVFDCGSGDLPNIALPDRGGDALLRLHADALTVQETERCLRSRLPLLEISPDDIALLHDRAHGDFASIRAALIAAARSCSVSDTATGHHVRIDPLLALEYAAREPQSAPHVLEAFPWANLRLAAILDCFPDGLPSAIPSAAPFQALLTGARPLATLTSGSTASATFIQARIDELRPQLHVALGPDALAGLRTEARSLLSALGAELPALSRARALHALGESAVATTLLIDIVAGHTNATALRARAQLAVTLSEREALLHLEGIAARVSRCLGRDAPSRNLALLLARQPATLANDPDSQIRVLQALEELGETAALHRLLKTWVKLPPPHAACFLQAGVQYRVAAASRDTAAATEGLLRATLAARALGPRLDPAGRVRLLQMRGQRAAERGRLSAALRLLSRAHAIAARVHDASLSAHVEGFLGIVCSLRGDHVRAVSHLEAALKYRSDSGDIRGAIASAHNLSVALISTGRPGDATRQINSAVALSLRHDFRERLAALLHLLGTLQDQQFSSTQAATTLRRAYRVAQNTESKHRISRIASELASLLSARGLGDEARTLFATAARCARGPNEADLTSQTHYRTHRLLAALHAGSRNMARTVAARLVRSLVGHSGSVTPASTIALVCTGHGEIAATRLAPRPPRGDVDGRADYRLAVSILRAAHKSRSGFMCSALGRTLPRSTGEQACSGPTRRAAAEAAIYLCASTPNVDAATLEVAARHTQHARELLIHARVLATQSTISNTPHAVRVRLYVDALREFSALQASQQQDYARPLPNEILQAYDALSDRPRAPTRPTLTSLQALAHRLSLSTDSAHVPDERMVRALRNVLEATSQLDATGDLPALLQKVALFTADITSAERACVVLSDVAERPEQPGTSYWSSASLASSFPPVSQAVLARAMRQRRPQIFHDVFADEELMQRPSISRLSLRSIVCAPITRAGKFYGVVYADSSTVAASFDHVDLDVLSLFAQQVASSLESRALVGSLRASMDELRAAQERLVRGERLRTLGELSSGVAHEFNNLLTGIIARIHLARMELHDPDVRRELEFAEKAALDASTIVRRLQSFTRREREHDFCLVDLSSLCRDAVEFLRPMWGQGGHSASPSVRILCTRSSTMFGSPTELRELLANLIKNAVDATSEPARIEIRTHRSAGSLVLEVEDCGPGIPDSLKVRVLDPFFTTKGERGTGLGLPICCQIVERHGGTIQLLDGSRGGLLVRATFPHADAAPAQNDANQERPLGSCPERLRILVVDDDQNVREPLRRYLERSGHTVYTAADGTEAVAVLESGNRCDVVVSDLIMPRFDGVQLCERVTSQHPEIVLILMTARADAANDPRVQGSGASAILTKPFTLQRVQQLIGDCLGRAAPHSD